MFDGSLLSCMLLSFTVCRYVGVIKLCRYVSMIGELSSVLFSFSVISRLIFSHCVPVASAGRPAGSVPPTPLPQTPIERDRVRQGPRYTPPADESTSHVANEMKRRLEVREAVSILSELLNPPFRD